MNKKRSSFVHKYLPDILEEIELTKVRIDRDQIELDAILFGDFEVEKKKKKKGKLAFLFLIQSSQCI